MEEEQPQVSSTWPPPPPFWRDFKPESLARIDELRKQQAEIEGATDASKIRLRGLPRELRNLQPPIEPADGVWRVFGDTYRLKDELPKLEDVDVRRLFPDAEDRDPNGAHIDRALILKRIAKSLLLNFLELVGIMSINADAVRCRILTNTTLKAI